ncbi:HNH endonuclease [bacterium]|nr:HNH endonuclease [bacterium]
MASIQKEFMSMLEGIGKERGFQCQKYESKIRRINNIIELSGRINCLLYFKIRSESPYRWGVTKNRIEELQTSGKKWFIVLLLETPNNGYLLTDQDVERYVNESLWPLGRGKNKNEYKISTGKTLQYSKPFHTVGDFINLLGHLPTDKESLSEIPDMRYEEYPPNKITTTITRAVRDTALSNKIKEERNYQCQVCGTTLIIKGKGYAETHHVKPLGQEGPDIESNMLVLCPNHHILFDYGEIAVSPEDGIAVIDGGGHGIGTLKPPFPKKEYIEYHYHNIYKK